MAKNWIVDLQQKDVIAKTCQLIGLDRCPILAYGGSKEGSLPRVYDIKVYFSSTS